MDMNIFQISDRYSLGITDETIEILLNEDFRNASNTANCFFFPRRSGESGPAFRSAVAVISPGIAATTAPNSAPIKLTGIAIKDSSQANGEHVISCQALFGNATTEDWTLSINERTSTFRIDRSSKAPDRAKTFRICLPRTSVSLELWHTGEGHQTVNEAMLGVGEGRDGKLENLMESEVLFYTVHSKNCLLTRFSDKGKTSVQKRLNVREPLPGEPQWELNSDRKAQDRVWEFVWESNPSPLISLEISCGIAAVTTHFHGRKALHVPQLAADFGDFYYYMFLGCLPLNLRVFGEKYIAPRCNVLIGDVDCYRDSWSRDATWAYEFLYSYDPKGIASLIENFINASMENSSTEKSRSPAPGTLGHKQIKTTADWDDAAAEILLMAGRHFMITGDTDFARTHLLHYHRCAEYLVSLRRTGEDLPITNSTWDGQGSLIGKEPYFIAECYAGLLRLSEIELALGNLDQSKRWRSIALSIQRAARQDFRQGGLWHTERGTFINYIDYKDPALLSPRTHNWSHSTPQAEGVPNSEFKLYETIVPIWLGLLDDEALIKKAYDYIDSQYSYAKGRGEISIPPGVGQNFIALLDVCVRQKFGISGADRLLQFILDRAFDGGIPMAEGCFSSYKVTGPSNPDWEFKFYPSTHSGRTWDGAPYFGLLLQLHYGLDYSYKGWKVCTPKPIANYELTRINELRHGKAVYSMRWTGQGEVREILVDGKLWTDQFISHEEGCHEVEIRLGQETAGK